MKLIDIMKAYNKAVLRENAKLRSIYNNLIREAEKGVETDECDESAMKGEDFADMLKEKDPDEEENECDELEEDSMGQPGQLMTAKEFFAGIDADIKKGAKNAGGVAISEEQDEDLEEDTQDGEELEEDTQDGEELEEDTQDGEELEEKDDGDDTPKDDEEDADDDEDDEEDADDDEDDEEDADDDEDTPKDDEEGEGDETDEGEGMTPEDFFGGKAGGKGKGGK